MTRSGPAQTQDQLRHRLYVDSVCSTCSITSSMCILAIAHAQNLFHIPLFCIPRSTFYRLPRVCVLWTIVVTNLHVYELHVSQIFVPSSLIAETTTRCDSTEEEDWYCQATWEEAQEWAIECDSLDLVTAETFWITIGGLCWSQNNRASVSTEGSRRWEREHFRSFRVIWDK